MSTVLTFITTWLPIAVSAAVAFLAVIAPVTKSTWDNTALDVLRFVEDKVLSILFPSLKNADPAPTSTSAQAPATK